jgi:predicted nucleic acid-binding protein
VIAYLDASALVKLFLVETGSEEMAELWASDVAVATSVVSQTELTCALAAAVRDRRFDAERLDATIVDGSVIRERSELVATDSDLIRSASGLGARHRLRAIDAIHVASALVVIDASPTLVSWDPNQRRAAEAEGLPVYP